MVFHCIYQFSSVGKSCLTLPLLGLQLAGFPVFHHLPEFDCMYIPHNMLTYSLLMGAGSQHGRFHPWQSHAKETWQARLQDSRDSLGRSHPWQRSWGRDLTGKGESGLEGPPGPAQASTPTPESICLTILCLSPTLLTLTGDYPQPPFSGKKINLGL